MSFPKFRGKPENAGDLIKNTPNVEKNILLEDQHSVWNVRDRMTISSQAHAYLRLHRNTNHLHIYSDSEIYFRFDKKTTDTISTTKDLILPSNTLVTLRVPKGISNGIIVFHAKQVTSVASSFIRVVEG